MIFDLGRRKFALTFVILNPTTTDLVIYAGMRLIGGGGIGKCSRLEIIELSRFLKGQIEEYSEGEQYRLAEGLQLKGNAWSGANMIPKVEDTCPR